MTDKQICRLCREAANYTGPDAFASGAALSVFGPVSPGQEVDRDLFDQMRILWRIENAPFKDLLELMGLNQTQCSIRFCVPLRTVQDWAGGRRTPASYVRLMMAELSGIVRLRDG